MSGGQMSEPSAAAMPSPNVSPAVSLIWSQLFGPNSGIALSSPTLVNLDGVPTAVVGSRANGCLYARHLDATGSVPGGWGNICTGAAIDSTPAAVPLGNGIDDVVTTTGSTAGLNYQNGAIYDLGPGGNLIWSRTLPDVYGSFGPSPVIAASPAVGDTGTGQIRIVVGTVGLSLYSLDPSNGAAIGGWPQMTADSTFATAAIAPIGGSQQIVAASDSTAGPGALNNWTGGSVRLMTASGATAWTDASTEVVTSSPAVGNLNGSGPVVAYGHGQFWGGSDQDTLTVVDASTGALRWQQHLGGYTRPSPALADLTGNGTLDVVEPTWRALGQPVGGLVYAFDPNGNEMWGGPVTLPGAPSTITGGVATADLGQGYQDVVVATGAGWDIVDGRSGAVVATEGLGMPGGVFGGDPNPATLAMQNTPLVAADPSGHGVDVVVAGTYGGLNGDTTQGFMAMYRVTNAPNTVGVRAWPQFHHDAQLSG
jgi:hypothetical protein